MSSAIVLWISGSVGGFGIALMLFAPFFCRPSDCAKLQELPPAQARRFRLLRMLGVELAGIAALCMCGFLYGIDSRFAHVLLIALAVLPFCLFSLSALVSGAADELARRY